jgi:hypothetical protein
MLREGGFVGAEVFTLDPFPCGPQPIRTLRCNSGRSLVVLLLKELANFKFAPDFSGSVKSVVIHLSGEEIPGNLK